MRTKGVKLGSRTARRWGAFVSVLALALATLPLAAPAATGDPVLINEVLASTTGTDVEFVELYGIPGTSLAGLSFIGVESNDAAAAGAIDTRIDFGSGDAIGANGFYLAGTAAGLQSSYGVTPNLDFATNTLENSSTTYALVETSSLAGTAVSGSEVVLDSVGVTDATASTFFFGAPVVGPDGSFFPAGVRRVTDGVDTDTAADWVISDFNLGSANTPTAGTVAIEFTEIHYDNASIDVGEAIEVSGPTGYDMTGWSIVLYNGSGGAVYSTTVLSGTIPAGNAFTVNYPENGVQNGSPDGFALVDAGGNLVEFLSYEGTFTAVGGAANGVLSIDIGVAEDSATPIGFSLQKVGGVWQAPAASTFAPPLVPAGPSCADETVLISFVQGGGAVTPCAGQQVTVEGVVVGDYEGPSPALRGFYVQEEASDFDSDDATSEGVFVFNGNNDSVDLGDLVRVTGTAGEFQDQTQISSAAITVLSSGNAAVPADVQLPFPTADHAERYEGMLVALPQTLYVTEYFQLGRFGELVVSSGDRLRQPTDIAEPGAPAAAVQAANDLNRLKIDDALNNQNPDPIVFSLDGDPLSASNSIRGGDTLTGAVGVMTYTWAGNSASGNAYRVRPVNALGGSWDFQSANPRPSGPPLVGGTASVAGFNVLNYFVTLDDNTPACGPVGFAQECRGAETQLEFERQRVKLLAALDQLDADVVGLIELENTEGVEAMADIVAGLNAIPGGPTYDYVDTGTIGTDVIKVGLIYQSEAATPLGDPAVLDSSVDPRFDDELNRPALAQSFTSDDGEVFTVVVNHLKSKGCTDAVGPEADQFDGQGCWNPARTAAAEALVDWIATDPTGSGDSDVFVIGDLNSYAKEDPIDVLVGAGFVDLGRSFAGDGHYTYVFDGQWGYLDYAFASASVVDRVTGAGAYHINADEVPVLDYNTNFKSTGQIDSLFAPDEFRTSDHDPVVFGFCDAVAPTASAIASPSMLWPPNNKLVDVSVTLDVFDASGATVQLVSVTADEPDWNPKKGPDIRIVDDTTFRLRATRLGDGDGKVYTITYSAVDACGNETVFSTEVTVPISLGDD